MVAVLGASLLVPSQARAEPRFSLRYAAPADCGDADEIRRRVASLLGEDPDAALQKPLVAHATVQKLEQNRYRLTLDLTQDDGQRQRVLHGKTCSALADAAALVLALAINPEAPPLRRAMAGEPIPTEKKAASGPAKEPESRPLPPRKAPARRESSVRRGPPSAHPAPPPETPSASVAVIVGGVFDSNALPRSTVGPTLGGAVSVEPFRFALRGMALLPRSSESAPGKGAELSGWLGSFEACRGFRLDLVELGPCLGLEAGQISGQGYGVSEPAEGHATWLAVSLGAMARLPFARWGAGRLGLGAVAPLARPRFVLENVGPVYRSDALGARADAGVEWTLW